MFYRYLWKLIPKLQRIYLLERCSVVERQALNKLLSANLQYPEAFRQRDCLFIHVPKCAGNSICAALFEGWSPGHLPLHWYERQFPEQYASAFKFSFVRDPLDRAYSAYTFLRGNPTGKRDVEAHRLVSSYRDFDEFVCQWLDAENIHRQMHFAPQSDFLTDSLGCLGMDFIGRQENLAVDFQHLCERFGVSVELPHLNPSRERQAGDIREFCSVRTRRLIRRVYHRDYERLGYE